MIFIRKNRKMTKKYVKLCKKWLKIRFFFAEKIIFLSEKFFQKKNFKIPLPPPPPLLPKKRSVFLIFSKFYGLKVAQK